MRADGLVPVIALAAVLAAGCGGDDSSSADPTSQTSRSSEPVQSAGTGETSASIPSPSEVTSATTLEDALALAARDGFPLLAPDRLPDGWAVVVVEYGVEGRGTWQLDLTDAHGGEAAVRQALPEVPAAYVADIRTYLASGARPEGVVEVPPFGSWDRYEGVRRPRTYAVGRFKGTSVVLWADDAASLPLLSGTLGRR